MLGLVLSESFFFIFIFWELVGLSSYLLIGFWFEKKSASDAGKKAFIVNRIGDYGFLVGIMIIFTTCGVVGFDEVFDAIGAGKLQGQLLTLAGIGVFCGAIGKSAQFPLHVWLPDAMEGPTPVSALIHAATMVAAGVYLIGRVYPIFTPDAFLFIAYFGAHHPVHLRDDRPDAERHQEGAGLLDRVPARVHGHGAGRRRLHRGSCAPHHPRGLQGVPVPRVRLRDPRRPQPGHPGNGRPAQEDAHHLLHLPHRHAGDRRGAAVLGLLLQGHDPRRRRSSSA